MLKHMVKNTLLIGNSDMLAFDVGCICIALLFF